LLPEQKTFGGKMWCHVKRIKKPRVLDSFIWESHQDESVTPPKTYSSPLKNSGCDGCHYYIGSVHEVGYVRAEDKGY